LDALQRKLNSDQRYSVIAQSWEGDLLFEIEPGGNLKHDVTMYLDLWHGECRKVAFGADAGRHPLPRFTLRSEYGNFAAVLLGKMDPMTAMLTNKLRIHGSLGYMMRNVPTVLDFVRCAREITTDIL
jgi:putative sterol carrier protein